MNGRGHSLKANCKTIYEYIYSNKTNNNFEYRSILVEKINVLLFNIDIDIYSKEEILRDYTEIKNTILADLTETETEIKESEFSELQKEEGTLHLKGFKFIKQ